MLATISATSQQTPKYCRGVTNHDVTMSRNKRLSRAQFCDRNNCSMCMCNIDQTKRKTPEMYDWNLLYTRDGKLCYCVSSFLIDSRYGLKVFPLVILQLQYIPYNNNFSYVVCILQSTNNSTVYENEYEFLSISTLGQRSIIFSSEP